MQLLVFFCRSHIIRLLLFCFLLGWVAYKFIGVEARLHKPHEACDCKEKIDAMEELLEKIKHENAKQKAVLSGTKQVSGFAR